MANHPIRPFTPSDPNATARLLLALDRSSTVAWALDLATMETERTPRHDELFGYAEPLESFTMERFRSHIHPDDLPLVDRRFCEALAGGESWSDEFRIVRADGAIRWVRVSGGPEHMVDGKPALIMGITQDITDQKVVELDAQATRRTLEAALDSMSDAVFISDAAGNFIHFNEAFATFHRFSDRESCAKRLADYPVFLDVFLADGRLARLDEWAVPRALRGEVGYGVEFRLQRRDTGESWIGSYNYGPIRNADGCIAGSVVVGRDVTEQRNAEERLRAADAKYKLLADHASDVIWLLDVATGRFTYVSPSVEKLRGYTSEEVLQQPMAEAVAPESYKEIAEGLPARLGRFAAGDERARSMTSEVVQTHKNGGTVLTEVVTTLITDDDGKVTQILGVTRDISARHEVEQALRRSEERYRNLIETTFDWIWEVDRAGRYTYASPKVTEILGYSPEEVLGKTPFDLMLPDEARRVEMIFGDILSRREPFSAIENTNRHKDGRLVVLESSGIPVFDAKGEFIGYRGMDRDVTDRRRLEDQLRQAQKLEAIGQLAGGVAHDFNNILAATMMHIGLLQMNDSLDGPTRQALVDLETESRRAAALTRQLLMFSRRSVMELKPLDLNEVVTNLARMLRRLIGEHIELRVEGNDHLPSIMADAGMLEQVVVNLVVNARDAMPRGGHVAIRTSIVTVPPDARADELGRYPGRFVCMAVADTGSGMDAATLARIFEPFFTTKESGKGTGLGLATVHGIVAQHKGWVEVSSRLGFGSTFKIFIPASEAAAERAVAAEQIAAGRHGGGTILVVEDEAPLRSVMVKTLVALGYKVFDAANGQHAVQLWTVHGGEIDLIVTDMVMPEGMTGLELIEHVRTMKPKIRAIICSGYSADIVRAGVPQKSDIAYLPKPFSSAAFGELVRSQIERE